MKAELRGVFAMSLIVAGCSGASGTDRPAVMGAESAVGTKPAATGPAPAESAAAPRTIVDSILPIEEEIRRFRARIGTVPTRLEGGERSRDALIRRWARSVESRDSVALRRMLVSEAEYIEFYYPESPYTRPPYRQSPRLHWFLLASSSSQGAGRVWERHAGHQFGYAGHVCGPEPEVMGRNRLWQCEVRLVTPGETRQTKLFGLILERDRWFKFLSYGGDY